MKRRAALLVVAAFGVSACGFQLRGSGTQAVLPFKTVHIGLPGTSSLGNELRRYIRARSGTTLVPDPKAAEAVIDVLSESREKTVLSLNSQGRVRENGLFYKLRFQVKSGAGDILLPPTDIV